jgi:hypothetical protein
MRPDATQTGDETMSALEAKIAAMTIDEVVAVLRALATDCSDEAARITDVGLSRLYRACSEEFYVSLCDELYAAWG